MNFTDEDIEAFLSGIYSRKINEYKLPKSLYEATVEYFKKGLYEGFGQTLSTAQGPDLELLKELRESVYMFSAAKTYQQTKELSSLLVDSNGNIISRAEFNRIGRDTFNTWNNVWGSTEYDTAIASGNMSAKWNDIQKQELIFPMLRYSAVGGEETCEICGRLDNMIAPVNDAVWSKIYPPNHFNCMCTVLQERDAKSTVGYNAAVNESVSNMQGTFINNVGISGTVFTKGHPYFDVPKKDKAYAKRNFDLPIPQADSNQFVPVKTIRDAEERMKALGIEKVNLSKLNINNANIVLEAFENEALFAPLQLKEVDTVRRSKSAWGGMYSNHESKITINASHIDSFKPKPLDSFDSRISKAKTLIEKYETEYLGKPNYDQRKVERSISQMKLDIYRLEMKIKNGERPLPFTFTQMANTDKESFQMLITHEIGHMRHYKDLNVNDYIQWKPSAANSDYGKTNVKEYLAEWYTQYRHRGPNGVPNNLLSLFKSIAL